MKHEKKDGHWEVEGNTRNFLR